jgi:opacity protein-like surface antigen
MKNKIRSASIKYCLLAVVLIIPFFGKQTSAQIFKPKQTQQNERQTVTASPERESTAPSPGMGWSNDWRVSLGVGTALFFGDIKQYNFYPVFNNKSEWRFNANLIIEKQLSPVFSLRGQGVYAHYAGTKREWDRNFVAKNTEFNLNTAIDLNNLFGRDRKDRFFTTSVILGVGLINFNSTLYELSSGNLVAQGGFGNGSGINGQTLEGIVIGGFSFDFRLDDTWSLRLETANRIINSDLFDLTASGGFKYDVYNNTSIGISYTFNKNKKRVSKVPESEPEMIIPTAVQNEPIAPENSLNQVVEVLAVEEAAPAAVIIPEVITKPKTNEVAILEVEYRVQIRAKYEGKVPISELSNKYNIPENEISESSHNRYYIYTVGSYATYEQAAQKRNELKSTNKIFDAFVVAFKNGVRLNKLP